MPSKRVRLVHWNADEAAERAARLRKAGYRVDGRPFDPAELKKLRRRPPDAVVIDLGRLPSQGRDLALVLREQKATRAVPLVFVEGQPAKVARIRRLLPDATFTSWSRIRGALRRAIEHPPAKPMVPGDRMAGYSGTPLPKKLGIKPGSIVALAGAPAAFDETLGDLPDGVTVRRQARGRRDLTIWFVKSLGDLERRVERFAAAVGEGGLWIAWPKKASGVATDVSERDVRRQGLDAGLVDYKICAIDDTWSGLKFSRRRGR